MNKKAHNWLFQNIPKISLSILGYLFTPQCQDSLFNSNKNNFNTYLCVQITVDMNLFLEKPLIIFDIEATGASVSKDRIIDLVMLKVHPDQKEESRTWIIDPTIPIPLEVSEIHGYYDKDVAGKPTFKEVANEIIEFIGNADFAGYNSNRYDIPLLVEEFLRVGIILEMEGRQSIDVMRIFMKKEQRTLEAALMFYCKKELVNAHTAGADVAATYDVLKAQLDRYEDLENKASFLHEFSSDGDFVDYARRMYIKEDEIYFNFGKHRNRRVEDVLEMEPQYYSWIMNNDFPLDTKNKLKKIKLLFDNRKQ